MRKVMKRKIITLVLCILIAASVLSSTISAKTPLSITHQPQNSSFPENASAMWSVEAEGENLVYDWFIVYDGIAYNTKKSFSENHPWQEGITGDGYGNNDAGNVFFINGIGMALNGAEIYCVISDGTYSVTSSSAYITVGTPVSPPEITVPASVEAETGSELKLTCQATARNGDRIASYLWYETPTGELKDISVIGAKEGCEETEPTLVCDTSETGTRYYVCAVATENGGFAYSAVIAVSVIKAEATTNDTTQSTGNTGTEPAGTEPAGTEPKSSESTKTPGTSDTKEPTDDKPISLPAIILIVAAGIAVIVTVAIAVKKSKTPTGIRNDKKE